MKTKRICALILLGAVLVFLLSIPAGASDGEVRYVNPETGYEVRIIDDDDLLTPEEEAALTEVMANVTAYGHAMFWSTDIYDSDEIGQAKLKRYQYYGYESSGIFMINMSSRKIVFQSDGRIFDRVSSSYARSITDNVSGYASTGDYYYCAANGFAQVVEVLRGNGIAEPMKYISYIVIALMLAFVIVVGVVFGRRLNPLVKHHEDDVKLLGSGYLFVNPPAVRKIDTKMRLWLVITLRILLAFLRAGGGSSGGSSSRSSGGGGGGSSGGGGGGSSSF